MAGTYGLYLNNVINKRGDAFDLTGEFPEKCPQMCHTAQPWAGCQPETRLTIYNLLTVKEGNKSIAAANLHWLYPQQNYLRSEPYRPEQVKRLQPNLR
jgi:hypothetical protein